jgi:hypothetical protein
MPRHPVRRHDGLQDGSRWNQVGSDTMHGCDPRLLTLSA